MVGGAVEYLNMGVKAATEVQCVIIGDDDLKISDYRHVYYDKDTQEKSQPALPYVASWQGEDEGDRIWRLDLWDEPDDKGAYGYFYSPGAMNIPVTKPVLKLSYDNDSRKARFTIEWEGDKIYECHYLGTVSEDGSSLILKSIKCGIDPECPFCGFSQPIYHKISD